MPRNIAKVALNLNVIRYWGFRALSSRLLEVHEIVPTIPFAYSSSEQLFIDTQFLIE